VNLEIFLIQIITDINEHSKRLPAHKISYFGFQSNGGVHSLMIRKIQLLIRNHRHPHPFDKETNMKIWKEITELNSENGLGILEKYKHDSKIRTVMRKFLLETHHVRTD
jgi:hypothetical protein